MMFTIEPLLLALEKKNWYLQEMKLLLFFYNCTLSDNNTHPTIPVSGIYTPLARLQKALFIV